MKLAYFVALMIAPRLQGSILHFVRGMLLIMNTYKWEREEMWALTRFLNLRQKLLMAMESRR